MSAQPRGCLLLVWAQFAWYEPHGQALCVLLYGLLGEVVGLPDAADGTAGPRTHCIRQQERHQYGLHHHHSYVLSHTGAWPTAKRLEETTRHLQVQEYHQVFFFF